MPANTLLSCITARRRRRAGRQPFYGTGWAARPGNYNAQPYYNNGGNYTQPPPQYSAQPQNSYYGQNQGYHNNGNDISLQPPQPTYARADQPEYVPPTGPPPGKGNHV